jgi:Alpha/beta hydrolase domain
LTLTGRNQLLTRLINAESLAQSTPGGTVATTFSVMPGTPMCSVSTELGDIGGIEEEYFFEGTATQFVLASGENEYPRNGRWMVEPADQRRFCTRMLVVRPSRSADFNGTVIVEWNNVSGGERFLNGPGAAQLLQEGFAVVGVSAQFVGVEGSPDHPLAALGQLPALKTDNPLRYGALHHPGDDYSYDIFTHAGQLLGSDRPRDLDPLGGLEVRHLIATGGSQSGARLGTYINAIQAMESVFDAFLLVVYPNTPCAMTQASAPAELPQTFGPNTFHLLGWFKYLLRDDLGVPIIVLNSESEASECEPNHQLDTEFLRWWDIPGTGHTSAFASPAELEQAASLVGGTTVSFAPATRGAAHALRSWLDGGDGPLHQPRLLKEGDPPRFPRDEHGNAIGGIRWPDLEAPLGTHAAERLGDDGTSLLRGSSTPFTPEKIKTLYSDRAEWFARYNAAVERLVESGVILPDDAAMMLARADSQSLPI